ncbi:MAG: ATP-binding protein [Eubacteriales bacterium]|nr:ATP-binding protein [Eubacteriales bacterium]
MPLQNHQYDTIMREYSRRQSAARRALEERRREAFLRIPRLQEIDQEVASLSAAKVRALMGGGESGLEDLKASISLLSQERTALLLSNGYPRDYLEMAYSCPICQDTGYVDSRKCVCFKRAEVELLYSQSNLQEILKKENFDHFSFDCYSDTITNEATGLTARETARRAYDTAWAFVRDFDTSSDNLLLYGDTGVGKTFLSHCIACELLRSAHFVLYFSAFELFDLLAGNAFSQRKASVRDEDPVYDCDLLIIDDLGTELTNSFVSSQLFLCINERIMAGKSTIISTNLTLDKLSELYSERTFSRIASSYKMIKLVGKDIRIQKIFSNGNI